MKSLTRMLSSVAVLALASISAEAANPQCNTAVQNWVNGSKTTCIVGNSGGGNGGGSDGSSGGDGGSGE